MCGAIVRDLLLFFPRVVCLADRREQTWSFPPWLRSGRFIAVVADERDSDRAVEWCMRARHRGGGGRAGQSEAKPKARRRTREYTLAK